MLEVHQERAAGAAHFGRKERAESEREDGPAHRSCRTRAPHAATPSHSTLPSASLGSPSMHSSNSKVRNSPSEHTQSPKSKQEAMVRSPPVMSPSSAAQMDSKLANPAKQGGSCGQSLPSPCDSKTLSSSHVPKGAQATTGSLPLKNGQGLNSAALTKGLNSATGPKGLNSGSGAKCKVKRERSTSLESFEPRDAGTQSNEPEQKDSSRVKRLCVAERRQPNRGVDWCSEGDSDEDEARYFNCNSSDVKPQGSGSLPSSNAGISRSSTPSHNVISEPATNQKPPSKIVYVFTTEMANKAAEAVLTGQADSIIAFHARNISHSKAEKHHLPLVAPLRNEPKPRQQAVTPPERNHQLGPKAPPFPPAQPPPSSQGANPTLAQGSPAPPGSPRNGPPVDAPDSSGPQPGFHSEEGGALKGGDPRMTVQQQQQLAEEIMSSMGGNPEGLSQEQLEHRERSLQTLRDIQRMLFPDERDTAPPANPAMTEGPKKPDQGPLQAMMAQSQSLGKPGPCPRPEGPHFTPPGPRDMPFSPDELGVLPPGPGMDPGDHMTPEQVAWLKLQQEFYEEKRRKQGQLQNHRPQPDFMLHQHGPRGLIRGPPPPYQMNPGEMWGPGGPEPFPEQMGMAPRGMHPPHPMQRMPGFPMMNPDMDPGHNPMSRPGLPWPDDIPKIGDGRGFPPGHGVFRGERFPNPQAVQEAMFQQGMGEKQPMGLPPGMAMEMSRMMANQRALDPRMPAGEGPISPSCMEFVKGLGRDMGPECGAGPMRMKDMHLGVSMGPGYGKPPMSPEQMKMRQGGGPLPLSMGPQQKMLQGLPFPDQPQPGDFNMGPSRQFSGVPPGPQGPGSARGQRGAPPFGPEQRTNMSGNGRLGHMQPLPPNQSPNAPGAGPPPAQRGQGRKPSDLNGQAGPVHPLKSPPLRQSPMLGSPSGNLKSPQTPSQLAGMLGGPPAPSVASIKSPSVMGSAGASPVHLKSPSLSAPSPGWTSSPKPPMQSPGIPQNSKPPLSMTSPNMMANMDQGGAGPPTAPQSSGQPGPLNLPGSLPSGSPFNLPPEPTLSQNPLSIMMSRMSKFAMPSSTPLYHDAIKTVASSDDDSPPARSPNLPNNSTPGMGVNNHLGHPRMSGPNPALSPMGMNSMGQPMSHSMPGQVPSPNPMGPAILPHGMMMAQDPGMMPQGRMGFPQRQQGFPPGQSPPQQVLFPHNGPGPQGGFPPGMAYPGEGGPMGRLGVGDPGSREPFNNMAGMFNDGDLHEVIRPGAAGIPEFDLSRIMPSEKPSQTLSYFPRGETPGGKPPHPLQIQGMMGMGEGGGPRMGLPMPGPGHMGPQDMPMGNQGQHCMRTPGFMPQAMMGAQHRMLSPGQHGMMGGPGMMQGKERGPMYSHQGPLGSPNMMMSLPGMGSPQQTAMMPPQMRPRGLAGDIGMGFNPGPGNPGNLMF